MNVDQLAAWLNATYPGRNWNQWCQRLMWNVVWKLTGVDESEMAEQPTAAAAREASLIVSTDPDEAPYGAMHWWLRPADGHVGLSLGGAVVLMTGTPYALGDDGYQLGNNYGVTTVHAYTNRMGNPYLGWSYTNGANPRISEEEEEVMTPEQAGQLKAVYDALFKQTPTSRGEKAGVLTLTNAIYDAQFKETETSRGTPGGTLKSLAVVLEQQAIIMKHLGIEPGPDESA